MSSSEAEVTSFRCVKRRVAIIQVRGRNIMVMYTAMVMGSLESFPPGIELLMVKKGELDFLQQP